MNIIDKALENRQLSQNSINLYKRNLLKLNDNKPIKNFIFLKNKDDILSKEVNLIKTNHAKKLYHFNLFCIERHS